MAEKAVESMRMVDGYVVKNYPEAASQSFKKGELVYLVSGKVTVCSADATTILGMALADASGTTDTEIPVAILDDNARFIANVYHATDASAVTAVTNVGVKYAYYVSSNVGRVDIGDTSNDAIIIEELYNGDAVGDKYGRVICRIIPAAQQIGAAGT